MLTLCAFGVLGHFLMIKAYEVAEAGTIQPFAYFQLVFVSIMGFALFGERPDAWTIAGAALILAAGLYTLVRQARLARRAQVGRGGRLPDDRARFSAAFGTFGCCNPRARLRTGCVDTARTHATCARMRVATVDHPEPVSPLSIPFSS